MSEPIYSDEYLKSRVYFYDKEKRIIFFDEVPIATLRSVDYTFNVLNELIEPFNTFYLIINLSKTQRPRSKIRKQLMDRFEPIKDSIRHCSVFTGKNLFMNMAAKFVMKQFYLNSVSFHKTRKEAELNIEKYCKTENDYQ